MTEYNCQECGQHPLGKDAYAQHLETAHRMNELSSTHSLAWVGAAARTLSHSIVEQKCPLCCSVEWQSLRKFVSHVCRHMEEVALSALPGEIESDSDGSKSTLSEPEDELSGQNRCPLPDCGKVFKDLKAHMNTHQSERPHKCPIKTCEYHTKGYARIYDKKRHTLTHYKGMMVCGFCPRLPSANFNRADVFKRHLTSVHRVSQSLPLTGKRTNPMQKKLGVPLMWTSQDDALFARRSLLIPKTCMSTGMTALYVLFIELRVYPSRI